MEKLVKTELIEQYLKENNISKTKFCKMCKISPSTLTKIMNNQNVRMTAIFRVTRAMGIYIHQIFN